MAVMAQCCTGLDVVRRHSVAAVGRNDEGGSLAGEHRVAHLRSVAVRAAHVDAAEAREELLHVAARDRCFTLLAVLSSRNAV
jgi:hypothetical protein